MQIIQSKTNFVEKVLRDKEGRLVRATFCVYENGGRIKARLVDFKYIGELAGKIFSLVSSNKNFNSVTETYYNKPVSSPYFNKQTLYFSGSKPRAPTF